MRTVIIDDDIFFTELLSSKLYKHGLTITNKIQSFEDLKNLDLKPDVFFIDFHLKGMNCNKVINYIESKYEEASIIVMSDNDYAHKLLNSKNDYFFLPKSKIRYLRFQIYSIKKMLLKRRNKVLNIKTLYLGSVFAAFYILLYLTFYL